VSDGLDGADPGDEVARIITRAKRLGFSAARVATALGLAELPPIRRRADRSADQDDLDDRAHQRPARPTTRRTQPGR